MSVRRKLPNDRKSITHKFSVAGHKGYIVVGLYDDGSPGELFIRMNKQGSIISGLMDTIGILTSISLQHGAPVKTITDKLSGMSFEPSGYTGNKELPQAKSVVDYIFRWLELKFNVGGETDNEARDNRASNA